MDREIKFRLIENGKVVGYETHELDTPCGTINIYHDGMNIEAVEGVYISHDSKEQYTGLKDKNGVEIYEGDEVGGYPHGTVIVRWCPEYACFDCVDKEGNNYGLFVNQLDDCKDEWEITGTIHDNKTK